MEFNVEIVLPSGRKVRIEELSNREYLSIIKFCENRDYLGLSRFFESKFIDPTLHIFDRFYLLIYIRMLFIESSISLTINEKNVTIQLVDLLDKIESKYKDLETKFEVNGIEVTLDLPCISYYENVDDLFISTIKRVKIGDNVLEFNALSKEEQEQVMDNLPSTVFTHITKFIHKIQDNLLSIDVIEENKTLGFQRISIDIIGNGVMQFIANIYGTDLQGYYTLIYMFQNTILPGSNYFFDMSPIETQIILNAHSKRVKEENEKLKNKNQR